MYLLMYLAFRQIQRYGDLVAAQTRQIIAVGELALEMSNLLLCKGGSLLARFIARRPPRVCKRARK